MSLAEAASLSLMHPLIGLVITILAINRDEYSRVSRLSWLLRLVISHGIRKESRGGSPSLSLPLWNRIPFTFPGDNSSHLISLFPFLSLSYPDFNRLLSSLPHFLSSVVHRPVSSSLRLTHFTIDRNAIQMARLFIASIWIRDWGRKFSRRRERKGEGRRNSLWRRDPRVVIGRVAIENPLCSLPSSSSSAVLKGIKDNGLVGENSHLVRNDEELKRKQNAHLAFTKISSDSIGMSTLV